MSTCRRPVLPFPYTIFCPQQMASLVPCDTRALRSNIFCQSSDKSCYISKTLTAVNTRNPGMIGGQVLRSAPILRKHKSTTDRAMLPRYCRIRSVATRESLRRGKTQDLTLTLTLIFLSYSQNAFFAAASHPYFLIVSKLGLFVSKYFSRVRKPFEFSFASSGFSQPPRAQCCLPLKRRKAKGSPPVNSILNSEKAFSKSENFAKLPSLKNIAPGISLHSRGLSSIIDFEFSINKESTLNKSEASSSVSEHFKRSFSNSIALAFNNTLFIINPISYQLFRLAKVHSKDFGLVLDTVYHHLFYLLDRLTRLLELRYF